MPSVKRIFSLLRDPLKDFIDKQFAQVDKNTRAAIYAAAKGNRTVQIELKGIERMQQVRLKEGKEYLLDDIKAREKQLAILLNDLEKKSRQAMQAKRDRKGEVDDYKREHKETLKKFAKDREVKQVLKAYEEASKQYINEGANANIASAYQANKQALNDILESKVATKYQAIDSLNDKSRNRLLKKFGKDDDVKAAYRQYQQADKAYREAAKHYADKVKNGYRPDEIARARETSTIKTKNGAKEVALNALDAILMQKANARKDEKREQYRPKF